MLRPLHKGIFHLATAIGEIYKTVPVYVIFNPIVLAAMKDHVYIIGAGAIGEALAVFLQLNGRQVTLLRGSIDTGATYAEKITVILEQQQLEAKINISSLSNFKSLDGIIVLTCKSFGNEALARVLKNKARDSSVVLLQNGLGVEQPFIDQGFEKIYRCVLFVTSQVLEGGAVRFKPVATCPIGTITGNKVQLNVIVEQLDTPYFSFATQSDIQPVIWKKVIANSVFNSVCPLLEVDNGIFHRNAGALEIANRIITECLFIAGAKGVQLSHEEVLESLLRISRFSDGQLISTLQDIRLGRRTEIETLNLAIAAMAKQLGMEHLVTETRLLGEITKLKSELSRAVNS
jgi:2-dehydropantoate 2-reductase